MTRYNTVTRVEKWILESAGIRDLPTRCRAGGMAFKYPFPQQASKGRKPLLPAPLADPMAATPSDNPLQYLEHFSKEGCVQGDCLGFKSIFFTLKKKKSFIFDICIDRGSYI